jgi:cystathionine beta-lyase/cystathionine gamma-synthase
MGSLEAWLLLHSLKTLHLRIPRQSATATALARWLQLISKAPNGQAIEGIPSGLLTRVWHSSLQGTDARGFNPQKQMLGGFNATFSIEVSGNIA